MGVEKIFQNPDFSDLAESDVLLKVVKAVHKAVIEFNEEETEASAATVVISSKRSGPRPVRADRPFLFIIKDNVGRNFFIGRFMGK